MAQGRVSEPSDAHLISSPACVSLLRPATLIDSVFVSEGVGEGGRKEERKKVRSEGEESST